MTRLIAGLLLFGDAKADGRFSVWTGRLIYGNSRMSLFQRAGFLLAALGLASSPPASAQVQSIDPNSAIDSDLDRPPVRTRATATPVPARSPSAELPATTPAAPATPAPATNTSATDADYTGPGWAADDSSRAKPAASPANTYREDDLIGAAEGVFGQGSRGLALMIRDILKKQGEPNGYITGREAGGAVVVGLRYGSGTLHHKIEGVRPVYWTGPSVGFDFGANAGNTFVLVYNLNDSEDLFRRYAAGEGQAYLIGGFNVSYLRRGNIVLIPVRLGAGLRLGLNAGYMKFRQTQNWVPF
jgi:hypothetical protein